MSMSNTFIFNCSFKHRHHVVLTNDIFKCFRAVLTIQGCVYLFFGTRFHKWHYTSEAMIIHPTSHKASRGLKNFRVKKSGRGSPKKPPPLLPVTASTRPIQYSR